MFDFDRGAWETPPCRDPNGVDSIAADSTLVVDCAFITARRRSEVKKKAVLTRVFWKIVIYQFCTLIRVADEPRLSLLVVGP